MLRLMLDSHPAMAIPTETHFLPQVFAAAQQTGDPLRVWRAFVEAVTWPNMGVSQEKLLSVLRAQPVVTAGSAARAFYRLYAEGQGKTRWGDKTPPYRACMGKIASGLPEARFVHIFRDGRDVALSHRGLWFGPGDDIAAQAKFWVEQVRQTRELGARMGGYTEIRYEDLVRHPEDQLRTLCDWLELDYRPCMLMSHVRAEERLAEFVQAFGPAGRPPPALDQFVSIHNRTREPPDVSRIGRWKTEFTEEERRIYADIAGPTLDLLGYEL